MKASEFKFLLKLLSQKDYRASISQLSPSDKTSSAERDKICRDLAEREIVSYAREVKRFKIEPAGKALLTGEAGGLPLTEQHFVVLRACESKIRTPGDIKKLSPDQRQAVIQDLQAKGLIKAESEQIKEVWLTDRGYEYLRDEYSPSGTTTISFSLLGNYLAFMRKAMQGTIVKEQPSAPLMNPSDKPADDKILQTIKDLDAELGTENYLPIFHLRQKLQPLLSRDDLDQALYRLQRQDKIEMSSLAEAIHYTPEQIQAGIPQDSAGPLFFLVVNG
jgi:hypothetical protein